MTTQARFTTSHLPSTWYQAHLRRLQFFSLDFAQLILTPSFCPFLPNPTCDEFLLLYSFFPSSSVVSSPLLSSFILSCPLLLSSGVIPSPPSISCPLLLLCCVHVGSDSLQKGGLQPRHLTLGLQGQYEACSWWRECKYCLVHNQSLYASAK